MLRNLNIRKTENPIIFVTIAAMMLQTAMLALFWALPDALGLSMRELFKGKELWQLCMAYGAILFISFFFALWQWWWKRILLPTRLLAIFLGFYFAVATVDYEVLRFSHQRLSYSFLRTYFHTSNIFDSTTVSILSGSAMETALWLALLFLGFVGGIATAILIPNVRKIKPLSFKIPLFLGISGIVLSAIPLILFLSGTRGIKTIPIINATVDMRFTLGKHTLTAPILHIGVLEIFERFRDNYKATEEDIKDLDAFLPPEFSERRPNTKEFPTFRTAPTHGYRAKIPYNIILVFGESYKSRIFNLMLSGDTTFAPNLWKLAKGGGFWFKNAFSGGYPTVRGTTATYLGFPSHPNRDVPSFYASNNFTGFPELLTNYSRAYMTISNPVFDHTLPFVIKFFNNWKTIGNTEIEGTADSLGMDLTLSLLQNLPTDKPYLLVYNTAATHIPFYGYPNNFAPKPDNAMIRYRNALRYTDSQFGRLLECLEARSDFERTVIIILGDHDTPVDSVDYAYPQPIGVSASQIFLGIFSPDTNLFKGLKIREDVASQLDIAPTILDLAQVRSENHFWGYDLLTEERPAEQPALFFSENAYFLGFRDFVLTGGLASSEIFIGKNGFSPTSDSLSSTWRKRAIGTSKILRSLLRDDKMQPRIK
ncbi:MAG: sulfatase-like hydrolase/transferase [Fibromonadales bacterium]|nr:sulfatase-like hydrolase/transferase [Fibromonadales bacterium]